MALCPTSLDGAWMYWRQLMKPWLRNRQVSPAHLVHLKRHSRYLPHAYASRNSPLDTQLCSRLFAAVRYALLAHNVCAAADIVAIGCHGQTVWHADRRGPAYAANGIIITSSPIRGLQWSAIFGGGYCAGRDKALVPAFHHALLHNWTENV
ncbi:anhydro-N-acetylmuramic acid kinase [Salmonella enterica subsp. enterica]|nr:anhydro-N-acetylmuramic acid kinase [Salmonella enterica subsp. enterica]